MSLIQLTILAFALSIYAKAEHFCNNSTAYDYLIIKDSSPLNCDQIKKIDSISHEVFKLSPIEIESPSLVLNGEDLAKAVNTGSGVHIGLDSKFKDSRTQQATLVHELGHTIFHNYFYKEFYETKEYIDLESKIQQEVPTTISLTVNGECKSEQCKEALGKLQHLERRRDQLEIETQGIKAFMMEFVRPYNKLVADSVAVLHFEDPQVMQHTLKHAKPNRENPHADCRSFAESKNKSFPLTDHCAFSELRSEILRDILLPGIKSGNKKEALGTLLKLITNEATKQYQKILEDTPKHLLSEKHESLKDRKYIAELNSLLFALRNNSLGEGGMPDETRNPGKETTTQISERSPSKAKASSN